MRRTEMFVRMYAMYARTEVGAVASTRFFFPLTRSYSATLPTPPVEFVVAAKFLRLLTHSTIV